LAKDPAAAKLKALKARAVVHEKQLAMAQTTLRAIPSVS
jgi:hypothetical protein